MPSSSLPCQLDKPMHSKMSQTYANILKKQFSLALTPTPPDAANNHPPRKWQVAILDYDLDCSTDLPATTVASTSSIQSCPSTTTPTKPISIDYAAKVLLLKTEIADLQTIITSAVAQIKSAFASLPMQCTSTSNDMETEAEMETTTSCQSVLDIQDLVTKFKHDIATFVIEMKAMFIQQANPKLTNYPLNTSIT